MTLNRRRYVRALLGTMAIGASSGVGSAIASSSPQVTTESGPVAGEEVGDTNVFKGIPYAKQPVGDRRWRPPETPGEWEGTLDATEYGPACVQNGGLSAVTGGETEVRGSEACLNLNVWTPTDATPDDPRPVMVWIHGGGYTSGSNRYESRRLSEFGDVVVVTINYRLGPFGFFTHRDLLAESPRNVNQGYQDTLAALGWVQQNVQAFGGDPDNVTIFGESAGGNAVLTLMSDPATEGLFHRVISQSGPVVDGLYDREEAAQAGVDLATELGCTGSDPGECLRAKSPEEILNANAPDSAQSTLDGPLGVTVDGEVIEKHPAKRFADGEFNDVPLITGGNADETQLFLLQTDVPSADAYESTVRERYGELANQVLETYPASEYETPKKALIAATTDATFLCGDRLIAKWIDENGGTVYRYLFDDRPTYPLTALSLLADDVGAYHAAELAYVFGEEVAQGDTALARLGLKDRLLSRRMQDYWTTFAETGDPNSRLRPDWPQFSADGQEQVRLTEDWIIGQSGPKPECALWEPLYRQRIGL
ncbi:carboxylesterase/lipase family protein [Natrinema sp. 1APR25-10V2]|uniref:carboxylesterase/lipase family protein n=1 Tax=Natrinema sp. 1APR25-10V2 TaxID=2951081 RepID=UPI002875A948|nr:carboxylesterase/lipase family protein [Natrinema sp. 1APR25-10V2]MDS0474380.1 carboxylesterase family protein [Natrinema sp. 1APR25-10V2]